MRFSGKIMVVTGGAGAIGGAAARRAVAEGATVISWDMRQPEIEGVNGMVVDLCDSTAICAARDEVVERFGGIDILILAAGITGDVLPVDEMPFEEWRRVMAINLDSVWLCCHEMVPDIRESEAGRIVILASIAGKEGNANQAAYSAAKAGAIALTKSLGKELAETNVRVNAIAPALIETPLIHQMPEQQRAFTLSKIPMKRAGKAEEVAAMALWLASDECSFSTGAVFDISGGRATF